VLELTCSESFPINARVRFQYNKSSSHHVPLQSLSAYKFRTLILSTVNIHSMSSISEDKISNNATSTSSSLILTFEQRKSYEVSNISESDRTVPQWMGSDTDLSMILSHCGLSQYLEVLVQNGFDDWATVQDIQEVDLEAMEFKLGHRRKLQRQIINFHVYNSSSQNRRLSLDISYAKVPPIDRMVHKRAGKTGTSSALTKRKYQRHPKPDPNAPTKPKTGYVLFSNHLRLNPEIAVLSFAAIAKHVGHKWQLLGDNEREIWGHRAAEELSAYRTCLETYKLSINYADYEVYLANFRKAGKNQAFIHEKKAIMQKLKDSEKPDGYLSSTKVNYSLISCLRWDMRANLQ
jgi:hypothetical protein